MGCSYGAADTSDGEWESIQTLIDSIYGGCGCSCRILSFSHDDRKSFNADWPSPIAPDGPHVRRNLIELLHRGRSHRFLKFIVSVNLEPLFEMAVRQILAEEGFIVKLIDESGQAEKVSAKQGIELGMQFLLIDRKLRE